MKIILTNGMGYMAEQISCAFTGHRPQSFPWRYDETSQDCITLKDVLKTQIELLIGRGITTFFSGLAQGVDTWAAQIVLDLRQGNPALKLHCVLPCRDQAVKWESSSKKIHQEIQDKADFVTCLSEDYYEGCMLDRNKYLVDHASVLLAVYNGSWRGGTAMTVRYAQKEGKKIIIINPRTREITYFHK